MSDGILPQESVNRINEQVSQQLWFWVKRFFAGNLAVLGGLLLFVYTGMQSQVASQITSQTLSMRTNLDKMIAENVVEAKDAQKDLEKNARDAQTALDTLRKQLDQETTAEVTLRAQHDALKSQYDQARSDLDTMRTQILMQLQSELARLPQTGGQIAAQLIETLGPVAKVIDSVNSVQLKVDQLQASLAKWPAVEPKNSELVGGQSGNGTPRDCPPGMYVSGVTPQLTGRPGDINIGGLVLRCRPLNSAVN